MTKNSEQPIDIFQPGAKGLQHNGLRRNNERAVLTVIGFNPGLSNAEIARMSGLAPQTVSAILNDIERAGLIERGPVLRGRRGQPAMPIFLKAEGGYSIGIEIGWCHAQVLVIDLHGRIVGHRRFDYAFPDPRTIIDTIAGHVTALLADWPAVRLERLADIGVAMPGKLADGLPAFGADEASIALWRTLDVGRELETRLGLPVSIFNDGNAACWSEFLALKRQRPSNFIYLLVSTYVGAGIIGEGRLWEGTSGHSSDLGAMLVPAEDGPRMASRIASLSALMQRLRAAGFTLDAARVDEWDWAAMEPEVAAWLDSAAWALALVVFNTTRVIEAGLVVLDTILPAPISERLLARLSEHVQALPPFGGPPPRVVAGHLGRLAPAVGAAELPIYRRHFSRDQLEGR
ncbi:MAG: ROK family transcriptional regulator [Devosia sp.]|nr:ROK family transcriptional regulator [Devosia sp.]